METGAEKQNPSVPPQEQDSKITYILTQLPECIKSTQF